MDAVDELAQLREDVAGLLVGLGEPAGERPAGRGVQAGEAEGHGERDEPLLGPVVQIPLDAPPLRLERVHQPHPGAREFADPVPGGEQCAGQLGAGTGEYAQRVEARGQHGESERGGREGLRPGVDGPQLGRLRLALDGQDHRRGRHRQRHSRHQGDGQRVERPQHQPEQHRVRQLPPGRRLPQPGRQPGGEAGPVGHPVAVPGHRTGTEKPQPPPLHRGHGRPGQRGEQQQRQPEEYDGQRTADDRSAEDHDEDEGAEQRAAGQVAEGAPGPRGRQVSTAAEGLPQGHGNHRRRRCGGAAMGRDGGSGVCLALPRVSPLPHCSGAGARGWVDPPTPNEWEPRRR